MEISSAIFHLTIPINDISQAKKFYVCGLGCTLGRENNLAVIFNFYGTQVVGHLTRQPLTPPTSIYPRHLGLILPTKSDWQTIHDRATDNNLTFYQPAKLRFPGQNLEHHTFFLQDPFYNLLEFKYYLHPEVIFGGRNFKAIGDVPATQ